MKKVLYLTLLWGFIGSFFAITNWLSKDVALKAAQNNILEHNKLNELLSQPQVNDLFSIYLICAIILTITILFKNEKT